MSEVLKSLKEKSLKRKKLLAQTVKRRKTAKSQKNAEIRICLLAARCFRD
jgi:hypothetical protein